MLADIGIGILVYVGVSWLWEYPFDWIFLSASIFYSFSPDLDFIPFVLLRKRLKLASHWLIHYPIIFLPTGAVVLGLAGLGGYHISLFLLGAFGHFIHDTAHNPVGLRWFWPLSNRAYAIKGGRAVHISEQERSAFYLELGRGAPKRGLWDEFWMHLGPELTLNALLFLCVAIAILIVFAYYL